MTETLDKRLERLYGPQKTKWNSSNYWNEFDDMAFTRVTYTLKQRGEYPKTGKEMAEILLGHKLISVGEPCSEWDVWVEGYQATGEHGYHEFVGTFSAASFEDACKIAAMKLAEGDMKTFNHYYDEKDNTWWGCSFYDNEADAARNFG